MFEGVSLEANFLRFVYDEYKQNRISFEQKGKLKGKAKEKAIDLLIMNDNRIAKIMH